MELETQASTEVPVVKVAENTDSNADPIKVRNGDLNQVVDIVKKQEDETAFEGEFIKIEKESFDVKGGSHTAETASVADEKPSVIERSSSNSSASREFLEAQEKVKELELELVRIAGALKHSESENSRLKDEVSLSQEKLEESGKKYEDLELNHKKVADHIKEAEERFNLERSTLQAALQAQETRHKELINMKEAFDGLTLELESSRKKMQELGQELQISAGEARKFEELHKESGSHAESETKRALEFEELLKLAKLSAKEMEDQMASLQEELKGLYQKIAENQKVEESLKSTAVELSTVQGELELSKSQSLDMEQRLTSKEAHINQLTQELDLRKASESQMKDDISAFENLFSSAKEDLHSKVSELEEIKLKLQEEVSTKELVEVALKKQEAEVSTIQEELTKVTKEKSDLETAVADLTSNAAQLKELCNDLETKLQLSDENFCKADSLLSQALANGAELEQKLKSLEELHHESGYAVATATQKNLELEEVLQASNAAAENAKSHLRELETRLIATEQRNVELEQQLNLVELKSSNAERELREFSEKISELNAAKREVEEEKKQLSGQMQGYEDNITQLESLLSQSSSRNLELELELKNVEERCAEHEGRANTTHQRSLELEDLIHISHSKADDAGKKVSELELFLETEKYRIQELEEQISKLENKCEDAEAESKKHSNKVSALEAEIEAFQSKTSSLEAALQMANEKERELTECLNVTTDDKRVLEEASKNSSEKLAEAENKLEVLRNELSLTQQKLESIESDLKAAGMRESEVMEKLKSAEEQLEQQGRVLEQATARSSELESLHETLSRDSELKLQEAVANFTNRDSEAKSLYEKLKTLDDQVKIYEEQLAEAALRSTFVKEELEQISMKLASSEGTNEELKRKISEAEDKALQSFSENELLVETNLQLKSKVHELEELLNSAYVEKETTTQQLASHMNTITELTDQHSKASELQLEAETRISEAETQLKEAIQKLTLRDSEARELNEKLTTLEGQIRMYEEQANEASAVAESRKLELHQTLLKLKDLESTIEEMQTKSGLFEKECVGLAEANLKLTQELATYESKLNDLQTELFASSTEKDEAIEQLQSSKKAIEDLTQQLTSEGQRLHTQISSVMEENNLLSETYQNAKKELEAVSIQFEEKTKEHKLNEDALTAEMENLKAEIGEKTVLQNLLKELEEKSTITEARLKEEVESAQVAAANREAELTSKLEDHVQKVHDRDILNDQLVQHQKELHIAQSTIAEQKEADSQKELEHEATLKRSSEELEAKSNTVLLLEKQVKELEQKLQLADAKLKEKADEGSPAVEVKSRDIGSTISTPSKRRSKKKLEATPAQTSSSSDTHTQTTEVSPAMTYKFILGIAVVSAIIGVILGKRY